MLLNVNEEFRVMLGGGGGKRPNELPPSRGWSCLVENIKLLLKPSKAQTKLNRNKISKASYPWKISNTKINNT